MSSDVRYVCLTSWCVLCVLCVWCVCVCVCIYRVSINHTVRVPSPFRSDLVFVPCDLCRRDAMAPPKLLNRPMNEHERGVQHERAAAYDIELHQQCAFIMIIARHRRRLMLQPSVDDHNMEVFIKALKRLEQQQQQRQHAQRAR